VRRLPFQPGRDLFFSADVASYSSRDEYFEALRASPNPLLLRNLSDQIFEVAGIAETKLKALAKVKTPLLLSFWCWAGNMLASFLLLYLHSGQK
jgi:hypothetical protein